MGGIQVVRMEWNLFHGFSGDMVFVGMIPSSLFSWDKFTWGPRRPIVWHQWYNRPPCTIDGNCHCCPTHFTTNFG